MTENSDIGARVWFVDIHNPNVGRGSLEASFENLTAKEAIAKMESNLTKAIMLRLRGKPSDGDLEALDAFQARTGKSIQRA